MALNLLLVILAGCISAFVGYTLTKRYPQMKKPFVVLGFFLLSFSVLPRLFPAYLYFLFPGVFFLEIVLACAFILTGVLAVHYRDTLFRLFLQGILGLLMVFFILFPPGYLALNSDYIKSLDYKVVDGVTIQSSYFGCVPSSIATVLRTYGLEYTEGDLAYALHTTVLGTEYSRIPRVVREYGKTQGLKARFIRTELAELRRINKPAILMVYSGRIRHATALLGFEGNEVILGEPLSGIKRISVNDFQERTRWTRLAVIIAEELED